MTQEIYQKQFSIAKILSESWERFTENFRLILIITLIVYFPINIILSLIPIGESLESLRIYMRVVQVLEGLIGVIAAMAIAYAIKNKIDGKTISVADALKKSLSRWGALIATNVILGIFLFGLILLLVIPGIIYSVYWIFASFAVILNNKTGNEALDYSKKIVKGRWWTVAGYSLFFGALALIVGLMGGVLYWFLPANFLTSIATDTLIDILASFFTVLSVIFFINFDSTKKSDVTVQV